MDRSFVVDDAAISSNILFGRIHRVILRGTSVFIDGVVSETAIGRDICGFLRKSVVATPSRSASPKRTTFAPMTPMVGDVGVSPSRARLFSTELGSVKSSTFPEAKSLEVVARTSKYIQDIPLSVSMDHHTPFYRKHVVSVKSFDRKDLHVLFGVAQEMRTIVEKNGKINLLSGKVMCSAFWEPSTRTSCSFESAMARLGGEVVSVNQITSSIAKGESLGDTG